MDINTITGSVLAKEKHSRFIVYTTTSPEDLQSVTSGLRGWVQPAKPDLHIRLLYEVLPKVYVFSEHKIFTTFCVPISNRISHFKILATS